MNRLESESNVGNDGESTESARYLPVVICSLESSNPTSVVSAQITLIRPILKLLYLKPQISTCVAAVGLLLR